MREILMICRSFLKKMDFIFLGMFGNKKRRLSWFWMVKMAEMISKSWFWITKNNTQRKHRVLKYYF